MKLSYRDKVIFICAIVFLVLIAGFFLFIKPKYEEMVSAKTYLTSKEAEKAEIEGKINTLTTLVEQVKATAEAVEEQQERFIVYQDPYLMEQLVYGIVEECDVKVTSMRTEYVSADSADEYVVDDKNIDTYDLLMMGDLYEELPEKVRNHYNGVKPRVGDSIIIGVTSMTIGYEDDLEYTGVMKFLDTIAEDERTIRVLSLNGNYEENVGAEPITSGDIPVKIYSIFPLNVEKVMEESDEVEIVPSAPAAE